MKSRQLLTTALTGVVFSGLLAGCAGLGGSEAELTTPAPSGTLTDTVEILRLPYGVPRIVASDHAGLGFGAGYVAAEDNLCLLMDRAMTVRGERAAYLGAGENNANIASDLYHRRILNTGAVESLLAGAPGSIDTPSEDARAFINGFAEGVNHALTEIDISDPNCAGAAWVRDVSAEDIWYGALTLPFGQPIEAIASAEPPVGDDATTSEARVEDLLVQRRGMGSNAYGIGSEGTRPDVNAVLLGNPHYPWDGALRFYRVGLTIPGELNVVGAGLVTTPFVAIGHTENIAWTHTVSTARRFGYYELTLDPENPTHYLVDGQSRPMIANEITIDVLGENGETMPVTRTVWESEFGPIAVSQRLPWSSERAFAFAAPNGGLRIIDQYLGMYAANDIEELHASLAQYQATAFNTMAVDHEGAAFYGDMGLVPNVDTDLVARCAASDTARGYWMQARIPILDASDPSCRWRDGDGATAPGVFGPSDAPHLFRPDFVAQSNDSPWLTNPAEPLTGYSPIWGDEATPRSLRTRLALDQMSQRLAGSDALGNAGFDLETVQAVMYSNRHLGGELLRDSVVDVCRESGDAQLQPLCDALAGWDLKVNLDSTGAHTMGMFILAGGDVFAGDFDPANGATTPVGLASTDPAVLEALRATAGQLAQLQLAPDAALGDVMGEMRGDTRIPIHGGPAGTGVFNMIIPGSPVPGTGWTSVRHGSSWIMTVEFSDEGVRSEGVLTYSQSTNPTSPHYGDQTELYSQKGWDALHLDLDDARAAALSSMEFER